MPRRRPGGTLLWLLLTMAAPRALPATEAELRVAMIFNIARFVQWPNTAEAPRFGVCALGSDAVTDHIALLADKRLHGLPVSVHRVGRSDNLDGCRVLYIAANDSRRLATFTFRLRESGAAMLTIGDSPDFLINGGMVQLLTIGQRQRFRINHALAQASGLSINAKLLQLSLPAGDE